MTPAHKEELDRFKLRSSKVRLADDLTLDIVGIRDVVLKTYFSTSWTLKDVRYIPGLKRRLISVGQLDEEGYHVGFGDQQWKVTKGSLVVAHGKKVEACIWLRIGMSMLASKINVSDVRKVDIYFCKQGGLRKQKNFPSQFIVNGDAPAVASASIEGPIPPKTAEQKIVRKNELKSNNTLLLAIPDEHLLKFHGIKDAKSLWEAIKTRFGGNKESKKIQKTILKQQYENFTASRFKGLDKIYDRFQKLISQLEIHGEVISQEDANLKLLRRLPSAWNNIALIMRNKPDLDELSMDDLYNNLKVYEAKIKSQSSSNSNSQNVAFVSSENTSSTNEAVNTALDVSTASTHPLLDNEDMEQIDSGNLEEMDFKWQVAMLTMRIKRFIKKTRRNLNLNGKEVVSLDMTKVECYNYHRKGHFARDCRALRNQGNRNGDNARSVVPVETSANALVVQDGIGRYDWSFQDEDGPTNFALMAYTSQKFIKF
ncbi:putative ribonuclease H-like domain-containing protein [Tanacetum coccineum]